MDKGGKEAARKAYAKEQETKRVVQEVLDATRVHHGIVQSSLDTGIKNSHGRCF